MSDWTDRFVRLARHVSEWSKDPSTQVGAVLVNRADNRVVGLGFNGFPRGVADDERLYDRDSKYPLVVHAEINAVLNAVGDVRGSTLYMWPIPPCSQCAAMLIQAGVSEVVAPAVTEKRLAEQWHLDVTEALLHEAGVRMVYV